MTFKKPNVLVIGSGGVGAIAALSLCLNDKSVVTLVVRSDYDYIKKNGFLIRSKTYGVIENWKPHNVAKSVTDARERFGEFDFIVVTTKNIPDGPVPCEDIIAPAITNNSTIILIQNGIGIEIPMLERFPKNPLLSAVSLIGSTYGDGVVENFFKDHIYLAPFANPNIENSLVDEKVRLFCEIYQNPDETKNKIEVDEEPQRRRWEKLVYNSVMNTTTALVNLDVNRCQMCNANDKLFRPAMVELREIAASEGFIIDEKFQEFFIHIGDGQFYAPSMCVDVRKSQLIEVEIILGNPLKIAEQNGVKTPILSTLYTMLKMLQLRMMEEKGLVKINPEDYNTNSDEYPKIVVEKSFRA